MRIPQIRQALPLVNGLFAHIDYQFWDFTADELDIVFLSKFSLRSEAPIVGMMRLLENDGTTIISHECVNPMLTDSQLTKLGEIILKMFKPKWDRLKDLNFLEYSVLYNYLDIYDEVLKDEKTDVTDKAINNASSQTMLSDNTSESTNTSTVGNTSSSDMNSTRTDTFNGSFTRETDSNETRTDNLTEHNAKRENNLNVVANNLTNGRTVTETSSSVRTDDLEEKQATANTKEIDNSQLNAKEATNTTEDDGVSTTETGEIDRENSGNINNSIYGFNSVNSVPTDGSTNADTSNETSSKTTVTDPHSIAVINKDVEISQLNSSEVGKNVSSKANVGTVSDEGSKTITETLSNGGSNSTSGDSRLTSSKVNTGTQATVEDASMQDTTVNTDTQTSESGIESTSNVETLNNSEMSASRTDKQEAISKMQENSTVSAALDRAKKSIHKGNLGNVAPQDLIRKEIELWRWNFINEVMDDVKSFISLAVYD